MNSLARRTARGRRDGVRFASPAAACVLNHAHSAWPKAPSTGTVKAASMTVRLHHRSGMFRGSAPFAMLAAALLVLACLGLCGCGGSSSGDEASAVAGTVVTPAKMNDEDLNMILFQAREGDTITLPAGKYLFNRSLKLSVNNVTLLGAGDGSDTASSTILSFKGAADSNGVEARFVQGVTLKRFAVEDAAGNAVFVTNSTDVVIDTVRAEWTTDPAHTSRMFYGLYPVACDNVLITNSVAVGANDAGVYVGQSKNIRVTGNEAYSNVAGVEIENSHNAVVENNNVHDNSAGVLVFAVPGAFRFADNDGVLVRKNTVVGNNRPIPGTASGVVRGVPPGTGVMIMAAQNTEVTANTIAHQSTAAVLVLSFQSTGLFFDPTQFDPYVRGAYVHGNTVSDFGSQPAGAFADPAGLAPVVSGLFASLAANGLPQRMAAVVWDGIVDPTTGTTGAQGEGGEYGGNQRVCSDTNDIDIPIIPAQMSYENIDLDLLALLQGLSSEPIFPFPPRLACTITLPTVTGLP